MRRTQATEKIDKFLSENGFKKIGYDYWKTYGEFDGENDWYNKMYVCNTVDGYNVWFVEEQERSRMFKNEDELIDFLKEESLADLDEYENFCKRLDELVKKHEEQDLIRGYDVFSWTKRVAITKAAKENLKEELGEEKFDELDARMSEEGYEYEKFYCDRMDFLNDDEHNKQVEAKLGTKKYNKFVKWFNQGIENEEKERIEKEKEAQKVRSLRVCFEDLGLDPKKDKDDWFDFLRYVNQGIFDGMRRQETAFYATTIAGESYSYIHIDDEHGVGSKEEECELILNDFKSFVWRGDVARRYQGCRIRHFSFSQKIGWGKYRKYSIEEIYKFFPSYLEWAIKTVDYFYIDLAQMVESLPTPTPMKLHSLTFQGKKHWLSNDLLPTVDYVAEAYEYLSLGHIIPEEKYVFSEDAFRIVEEKGYVFSQQLRQGRRDDYDYWYDGRAG